MPLSSATRLGSYEILAAIGSGGGFAVSPDKDQKFPYVVDGSNKAIQTLNRQTLEIVSTVGGHAGHNAREFFHFSAKSTTASAIVSTHSEA